MPLFPSLKDGTVVVCLSETCAEDQQCCTLRSMVLCGKISLYLSLKVVNPSGIDFGEFCCWKSLEDPPASRVRSHFICLFVLFSLFIQGFSV